MRLKQSVSNTGNRLDIVLAINNKILNYEIETVTALVSVIYRISINNKILNYEIETRLRIQETPWQDTDQ